MPIQVPQELIEKVASGSASHINKRKRSRPSTSGIMDMDQENSEALLNDIAVTNPNPPPIESRPLVLFSGFVNPIAEQKV